MTSLLEGARNLVSKPSDVNALVTGLETAVTNARGRLDDDLVDHGQEVVDRASGRLRIAAEHTVIAIAGATGSGKSSTFNALTGLEISAVGVRRPTTSWATACVWGTQGASELLEWLGIPARHQVTRDTVLDTGREDRRLEGTVLLDLPDHDSTEVSHHLEVDRLVQLADLLVWVLDPQKYADAAIHDRYLKPLSTHAGVMMVVLNHIDTVPEDRRDAMLADVRRLLDQDGLVRGAGARDERTARHRHRRPQGRDGPARGLEEAQACPPDRGRAGRGRGDGRGLRHRQARRPRPRPDERARGRLRRRGRRPDRGRRGRLLHPPPRPAGHRLAGHRVGRPAQARPAQAPAPRPRPRRPGADPVGAHLGPRADEGAAGPRRRRRTRCRRRRRRQPAQAVAGRRTPRLGVAPRRHLRPARPDPGRDRPRGREAAVVGGHRPRPAVAADPVGARRGRLAGQPRRDGVPPDARAVDPRRARASRCRR